MLRPMYCDRMVLLLLGNAANWGLALYGMIWTPSDFASYLLIIFLTNLLLYIAFYIIMKVRFSITFSYIEGRRAAHKFGLYIYVCRTSYLLVIFLTNRLFYIAFYIIMKARFNSVFLY